MRILHVIPTFSPPQLFGGSQRVVYLVTRALAKKGHEVVVYTSDMRSLKEKVSDFDAKGLGDGIKHGD